MQCKTFDLILRFLNKFASQVAYRRKYKVLFIIIIGNFSSKVFLDVLHTNNIFYFFLQPSVMFIFLYLNL